MTSTGEGEQWKFSPCKVNLRSILFCLSLHTGGMQEKHDVIGGSKLSR